MMVIVSIAIFSGAFALACYAIVATVVPNASRILDALAGRSQVDFAPLSTLVLAERRIAVRRWAANSPGPLPAWREAA